VKSILKIREIAYEVGEALAVKVHILQ